jgi:Tetracyclin repressor-like, C-terminal domain
MTAALRGDLAPQRAAIVLSLIAGFQVMRQMIGLPALAKAKPDVLVNILGPLFQELIDGRQPGKMRSNRT